MRLTIIRDDNVVIVDGRALAVDLAGLPDNLHAVQWDGQAGHVEFNDGTPNEKLEDISAWQSVVDAWGAARQAEDAPSPELNLEEAKAAKLAEIAKAHDAALAGLVAWSSPTPSVVAVEAALLAVSDPEGLDYARQRLAEQQRDLAAAVMAGGAVEDVRAVEVGFLV
ncbi:hypothetical protein DA2_3219 [Desulfovibrio sp. A2]|nr:hypothetical protein DA2_3219 [Desulfovibrio sp. A2]